MDEPISEDELAEWSHDIDLFMEGLTNPDNLEPLLEQSKVKKLWDDSQNKSLTQLDQYLTNTQPTEDSISIEDYMSRWCNIVQTPNSPTPQENHCTPQLFSPEKRDNLDKYNKFINELSVRIEGGWTPADHIPYDEDLLRHILGLSPRVKTDKEFYPDSDQVLKRNWLAIQPNSDEKAESDKKLTSTASTKGELQTSKQIVEQQFSEYEELPFQKGFHLKEDNKTKISNHDREIFMAILSDPTNQKDNPMALLDLDYDDFLSEMEASEAAAASYEIPPSP